MTQVLNIEYRNDFSGQFISHNKKNDIFWNRFQVRGKKEIKGVLLTTVSVDVVRLKEANLEIVQDGRFVQVAECCEVIFSHQDVRVSEEGKRVAVSTHRVLKRLRQPDKQRL